MVMCREISNQTMLIIYTGISRLNVLLCDFVYLLLFKKIMPTYNLKLHFFLAQKYYVFANIFNVLVFIIYYHIVEKVISVFLDFS